MKFFYGWRRRTICRLLSALSRFAERRLGGIRKRCPHRWTYTVVTRDWGGWAYTTHCNVCGNTTAEWFGANGGPGV